MHCNRPTHQVLGSALAVGDVVWSQGYRWMLTSVAVDRPMGEGETRTYCTADIHPSTPADQRPPRFYCYGMTLGLRSDLMWTRED